MKSCFSHNLDSLKRINGNVTSDFEMAKKAASEMESFIQEQSQILIDYENLDQILSKDSPKEIDNALISMNHVMEVLKEVRNFQRQGKLNDIFDSTLHQLSKIFDESKDRAKKLKALCEL